MQGILNPADFDPTKQHVLYSSTKARTQQTLDRLRCPKASSFSSSQRATKTAETPSAGRNSEVKISFAPLQVDGKVDHSPWLGYVVVLVTTLLPFHRASNNKTKKLRSNLK